MKDKRNNMTVPAARTSSAVDRIFYVGGGS